MSSSRAIKPKRDTQLSSFESMPERAPSVERPDAPVFARILGMAGLFLFVLGVLAMLFPAFMTDRTSAIPPAWGFAGGSVGLLLILYHAFVEPERQFRRIYGILGLVLMVLLGVGLRLLMFRSTAVMTRPTSLAFTNPQLFYFFGVPSLFFGWTFSFAVIRNETEQGFRSILLNVMGVVGAAMMIVPLVVGSFASTVNATEYLAGEGVVSFLFGLVYIGSYIGLQEESSDRAHYAGLAMGALGALGVVVGLIRSFWPESNFLVPGGLILIGFSATFLIVSLAIWADWPVLVIARRELAAYFYSPIAYLVLIGILVTGWIMFNAFVSEIIDSGMQGGMLEPIVFRYIFHIYPVIVQIFIVPVLTMRLLSEENRTGTLEVMLTAPVNEISVVLGKFFACWIFYMLTWLPWWIFLVSLRYVGGEEFDYRPVLAFTISLLVISSGLLSMGLFFSSLTGNQIIAAVLTFVGVLGHLAIYIIKFQRDIREGSAIHEMLTYINFFDLWEMSLRGILAPRYLVFHVSVAVFFLFATIKVLESRKWK